MSDTWCGLARETFPICDTTGWVALPEHPLPGNPWVWCLEFPGAFHDRMGTRPLCEAGFAYAHVVVGNTFGYDGAIAVFEKFHAEMVRRGFAQRAALVGISRGGLYAYRFASLHPECVLCIYGDAPVCDFRSWPGGFGNGGGSRTDWADLKRLYGFANDLEAIHYDRQPIDTLEPLARANIPLLHVVGDADRTVPWEENTRILAERYRALGGSIEVYHKSPCETVFCEDEVPDPLDPHVFRCLPHRCGHHPHGLADTRIAAKFIQSAWENSQRA